jgi:hypothetical protein
VQQKSQVFDLAFFMQSLFLRSEACVERIC